MTRVRTVFQGVQDSIQEALFVYKLTLYWHFYLPFCHPFTRLFTPCTPGLFTTSHIVPNGPGTVNSLFCRFENGSLFVFLMGIFNFSEHWVGIKGLGDIRGVDQEAH